MVSTKNKKYYLFNNQSNFNPENLKNIVNYYNNKDQFIKSKSTSKAKYLNNDLNLGPPSGRVEVEQLEKWLDFMVDK